MQPLIPCDSRLGPWCPTPSQPGLLCTHSSFQVFRLGPRWVVEHRLRVLESRLSKPSAGAFWRKALEPPRMFWTDGLPKS